METKEREEAESNEMKIFQDNGLHRKRAFNQYFNGKSSWADCKNGFGAHSLKVNTLTTGFNWPIHQESKEFLRVYINLYTYWEVLEDRTNCELHK